MLRERCHVVVLDGATAVHVTSDPAFGPQVPQTAMSETSPACARLPLPADLPGRQNQINLVFRP